MAQSRLQIVAAIVALLTPTLALRASLPASLTRRSCLAALAALNLGTPAALAETPFFKPSVMLSLEGAQAAMRACAKEADANGWAVTVVIVDMSGEPVLLERRGAAPMTPAVAMGKARSAVMSGKETTVFEKMANGSGDKPPRMALLSAPNLVLMEGGVPIIIDGQTVGAIGVSGVRSDQDAQVAKAGVAVLAAAPIPARASAAAASR